MDTGRKATIVCAVQGSVKTKSDTKWRDLPPDLLSHLFDRAKEREIPMEDLFALEEWRKHSPVNWRSAASAAS